MFVNSRTFLVIKQSPSCEKPLFQTSGSLRSLPFQISPKYQLCGTLQPLNDSGHHWHYWALLLRGKWWIGSNEGGGKVDSEGDFFCLDTHKTHTCTKTAFRDFQKNTSCPRYLLGFGICITFYFGEYEIGTFFQPSACGISQSLMIDWRDWSVGGEAYSRKLYQLVPKCLDLFVKMWFQAKQQVIL